MHIKLLPQFSEAKLMKNLFDLMFWGLFFVVVHLPFFPKKNKREKPNMTPLTSDIRENGMQIKIESSYLPQHKGQVLIA